MSNASHEALRERIARALYERAGLDARLEDALSWEDACRIGDEVDGPTYADEYRADADAVLSVLSEPAQPEGLTEKVASLPDASRLPDVEVDIIPEVDDSVLLSRVNEIIDHWRERMGLESAKIEARIGAVVDTFGDGHRALSMGSEDNTEAMIVFDPSCANHEVGLERIVVHELVHVCAHLEADGDVEEYLAEQCALLLLEIAAQEPNADEAGGAQ